MKHPVRVLEAVGMLVVFAYLLGCSPTSTSSTIPARPQWSDASAASTVLYAFSPEKSLVASYSVGPHDARPISILRGSKTQLSTGNGMAVDTDGTTYVIVYKSGSSGSPIKLLVFPPNARGNVAPERTAVLQGPILPGYAVGLALDGRGNFWITAIGKLLRYPTSAQGTATPNASIDLKLDTPDGLMPANASNVAVDSTGNVYCSCTVVFQGNQAIGISEYAIASTSLSALVRSFYDFSLPEVPPASIAIDGSGTIYLASSLPNTGVFAYGPKTGSGQVHYTRRFVSGSGTMVSSLTTDASGKVYVAAASRIMVFGSKANGHVRPIRSIDDPKHLDYTTGTYGTLLNVH
jgi:sugar lactone lactonase YvrE